MTPLQVYQLLCIVYYDAGVGNTGDFLEGLDLRRYKHRGYQYQQCGTGFGLVGPTRNFSGFLLQQAVLSFLMLVGRLNCSQS